VTERPEERLDARGMLADLLGDHETLVRQLRGDLEAAVEKYRDAGPSDFLTGLMEKHEKMAWMLRGLNPGPRLTLAAPRSRMDPCDTSPRPPSSSR
jgi:DNA-binding ferritin-like protein